MIDYNTIDSLPSTANREDPCLTQMAYILSDVGDENTAISVFESIFDDQSTSDYSKIDAAIFLTSKYSFDFLNPPKFFEIVNRSNEFLRGKDVTESTALIYNNISYGFLMKNDISSALPYLLKIASYVHKIPHITATYGLYQLKAGRFQKGEDFYLKAISLFADSDEKSLCKQKMNLELARFFFEKRDYESAKKHLNRSMKNKSKNDQYLEEIKTLSQNLELL